MKKDFFIIVFIFSLFLAGCGRSDKKIYSELGKEKKFIIEGTLTSGTGKKVYLQKISSFSKTNDDSAIVDSKQQFSLQSTTDYPNLFKIKVESGAFFVLSIKGGEKIKVTADYNDFSNYSLSGSTESEQIRELGQKTIEVLNKISALSQISQDSIESPNYSSIKKRLSNDFDNLMTDFREYSKDFIYKNSNSLASLLALENQIGPQMYVFSPTDNKDMFIHVDSVLMSVLPKSDHVISFHNKLSTYFNQTEAKNLSTSFSIGQEVPDISLPSPDGKILTLSSLKGKYVLLDFWASWCPPCRAENPNLVMNYTKYHSEGFEIFQVSLDRTRENWLKGIKEDGLNWLHVSDLKYWDSSVVPLYGIQQIPTSYLLDREGKIDTFDLRGVALGERLRKIFNK